MEKLKALENINFQHVVTLDNQKKMMLTGIIEVVSSTEKCVVAKTNQKTLNILGDNLRVSKLVLEEGLLIVDGEIDCFKYLEKNSGKSFFKKVFK